jgi:hypothetical protein
MSAKSAIFWLAFIHDKTHCSAGLSISFIGKLSIAWTLHDWLFSIDLSQRSQQSHGRHVCTARQVANALCEGVTFAQSLGIVLNKIHRVCLLK